MDFVPNSIGVREHVISTIKSIVPTADFADPSWGILKKLPAYHIEVNLGGAEVLDGFTFHVSGGSEARQVISQILRALNLLALDPDSESGLFQPSDT